MPDLDFNLGLVNAAGQRVHGDGRWTSKLATPGTYVLNFRNRFENRPAITVTPQAPGNAVRRAVIEPTSNTRESITVKILDETGGAAPSDFFFIAVAED